MNSGITSERVYDGLKRRLLAGDVLPGEKLEPARFADELSSSVTPVRDALHRLAGERLVDTRTSEGFYLPLVTEPGLRDLYAWNLQLVRLAVRDWPREPIAAGGSALTVDLGRATPAFFRQLALRAGSGEYLHQLDAASDRLATARLAEAHVFAELEAELRALAIAADTLAPPALLKQVAAYYRRRDRAVPAIVRALYRGRHG